LAIFAVKVLCFCFGKSKAFDRKERREVSPFAERSLQRKFRKEKQQDHYQLTSLILRDDSMPSSSGPAAKAPELTGQAIQHVNEGIQYDNTHRAKEDRRDHK
jgi:hypothetical protein